jgi:basic membrane protein A
MGTYFGKIYQARYLSGIAAGMKTETNKIGYVAAFPIPEVIRGINAFTLGVRSVNPDATVSVVWTNTWYDPGTEKQAALGLLDMGADVIAQHQDTPGPMQAAEERGAWGISYNSDMTRFAPNAIMTGPVWNWGPYYVKTVKAVMDGTWTSSQYWGPMSDGIVDLAPYNEKVMTPEMIEAVEAAKAKVLAGELDIFTGPIKDQSGQVKVPEGTSMTDEEKLGFNWFVEGVIGTL